MSRANTPLRWDAQARRWVEAPMTGAELDDWIAAQRRRYALWDVVILVVAACGVVAILMGWI